MHGPSFEPSPVDLHVSKPQRLQPLRDCDHGPLAILRPGVFEYSRELVELLRAVLDLVRDELLKLFVLRLHVAEDCRAVLCILCLVILVELLHLLGRFGVRLGVPFLDRVHREALELRLFQDGVRLVLRRQALARPSADLREVEQDRVDGDEAAVLPRPVVDRGVERPLVVQHPGLPHAVLHVLGHALRRLRPAGDLHVDPDEPVRDGVLDVAGKVLELPALVRELGLGLAEPELPAVLRRRLLVLLDGLRGDLEVLELVSFRPVVDGPRQVL
mmetsp:Transcript_32570/g.79241  ORF Transcript_32570/g.79241 Transcript_32570/m.79241 type:complete len:273 (-) Transcript_32570:131-949(-)